MLPTSPLSLLTLIRVYVPVILIFIDVATCLAFISSTISKSALFCSEYIIASLSPKSRPVYFLNSDISSGLLVYTFFIKLQFMICWASITNSLFVVTSL